MKKLLLGAGMISLPFFFPELTFAHAFGQTYTLPIPFWLYLYGGAAALVLSFLIIGFFVNQKRLKTFPEKMYSNAFTHFFVQHNVIFVAKGISLSFFLLTIITGLFGEDLSGANFNMTFFWVIFVLGVTYLTALLGNFWDVLNPWKILIEIIEYFRKKRFPGSMPYPKWLGYYPALLFYFLFICIELFARTTPFSLSIFILQYTVVSFFAIALIGTEAWFTYGDFLSVFFRFVSYCAPLSLRRGELLIFPPFVQLIEKKATDLSNVLFILFMLASTAFDGFKETTVWYNAYWSGAYSLLHPLLGDAGSQVFDFLGLLIAPFVFLSLFVLAIVIMKAFVKTEKSVTELLREFAFSLVPIALVYNIAHYFTLLVIQGQQIVKFISDPFGWNWNLFGTAGFMPNLTVVDAAFVWHFQVALILVGHIISVFLAHLLALRFFPSHKKAVISQLPMLMLMVAYTMIGLWILSQPIAVGG